MKSFETWVEENQLNEIPVPDPSNVSRMGSAMAGTGAKFDLGGCHLQLVGNQLHISRRAGGAENVVLLALSPQQVQQMTAELELT